ncbi:MAG: hypothetical protein HYZ37_14505 [Candidatus Solibacter usitatus]|nr:hypothetical protein [Candidatus Solibacter usitatus]
MVRYHDVELTASGSSIHLKCRVENDSGETWSKGFAFGYQIYDPATALFLTEGEWTPLPADISPGGVFDASLELKIPDGDGPYRVYVSPIHPQAGWLYTDGEPMLAVDAEMRGGRVHVVASRVTTLNGMRWRGLPGSIARTLIAPFADIWTHRRQAKSFDFAWMDRESKQKLYSLAQSRAGKVQF